VPLTKHETVQNTVQKVKREYKYWSEKFATIIEGYRDSEFDEQLVNFINDLNLA
jgi:hypothetical protein